MLSPVAAVSVVGASIEKPVVATAETSSVQAAATPVAVLSSAVNASAGGKLNMLLAAARERMFESLLSAIDAASVALNVPREPGESNAALAQRLVDAIRSLPPQQLAAAQQQLNAQMKTPVPLPLLAEALDNPDSPKAVQIAVSLDASLTQEPDAVIRAVVNSYGQNAGEPDAVGQQTPIPAQAMPKTSEAAATNTATTAPSALPEKMAAPSPTPVTASPSTPSAQAPQQAATTILQTIAGPVMIPVPEAMHELEAAVMPQTAPNPQVSATPQAASMPAAERGVLPQIAVIVEDKALPTASLPLAAVGEAKLPTEIALIRSPLTPPPVPRDIQQLQADIKQGLQVVISPAIDVTGPDLPQVTRSDMPLAERVIAQALAAGQQDLQPLPQTVRDESLRNLAAALAGQTAASSEEAQTASAAALPVKSQGNVPAMTIMDMSEAVAQTGTTIAPLLGIPFAIAHYLPADTPTEDDPKRVDRVDLVDEEREQGQGGETARDDSEDESPPEEADQPAAAAADPAAEDANVDVISASAIPVAPKIAALPAPAPVDPLSDHAFDFYRRMVGWE
ncbi:hypothetical protein G6M87_01405 [Rhizobium rhizogenes]|uniref:Uncharacterized protein n=1 Tax=Rhizobium rhizogenes (strain K84 / ATCC BAA-868) TaxID=311403 RepID=B9JGR2_RHIR8|nr:MULTISPECIES: hypothetical protein [Rhizobium]ACM24908.1 conserved hypothetical protein [Rhizobium rhizogenes K84]OCJ23356.1 hypothetical protein A6U88_28690 [Agrobacterium sp. B131/95]EJK87590.1 hypothetical protein PMI03_00921 [Rhizobium sp. AP16]NTI20522.1 hypothetical protein [Rhizobium rhizogenes]NTI39830.1 hypothetical protein [Rhizobium rhizogenes]